MKALLVNGSPHKEGCTSAALIEVAAALNREGIDTDLFWVGNQPIAGCTGCRACVKANRCVLQDTVNDFLELAGDYDGFVFGSPVHWAGASGALTSFLDRVFYADLNSGGNRFRLKPAAAVVSARRAGTTAAWDQLNKYFGLMQMLGKNMAFLLQCKRIALENGLKLPEQEPAIRTNFVGGAPLP